MRAHAGQYDHRVTVWKNVPTPNPDGQQVEVPTEFITRWARVKPVAGRERFLAQQTQADTTHRVRVRSDGQTRTITPAMWITLRDGTRLDITRAFDVDMRRVEIEMECNHRS
jgi:SPP1 family predicted phage head-tail adaptor